MALNLQNLAEALEENGVDINNVSAGGEREIPAAGNTRLRFVGYIETGTHSTTYQGQKKTKPRCELVFELSGPKHPPVTIGEETRPHRIVIRETIGQNEKNNYVKLFKLMNTDGKAKNFVQLLGKAYRGVVYHDEGKGLDGKPQVFVGLRNDSGYSILPTVYEDPDTGEVREVKVDPPKSPLRALIWNLADLDQWDSLFLSTDYNPWQEKIRRAENFVGSPVQAALLAAGRAEEAQPLVGKAPAKAQEGAAKATEQAGEGQGSQAAPETASVGPAVNKPAKAEPAAGDVPW